MSRSFTLVPVVLAALALAVAAEAANPSSRNPYDSRWNAAEKAFRMAGQSGDLTEVKNELGKFFASADRDDKSLGLRWIDYHKEDLSGDQRDELESLFIALNPTDTLTRSLRAEMARRHLEAAPVEVRRETYMTAIRSGTVMVESVTEIRRLTALGLAAADGLEEFRPFLEDYAADLNSAYPTMPGNNADYLKVLMDLRAGAKDRQDAVRRHAEKLAAMDAERLAALMAEDTAFRWATRNLAEDVCENQLSVACASLAQVALQQMELRRQREAAGRKQAAAVYERDNWYEALLAATATARVKHDLEAIESLPKRQ